MKYFLTYEKTHPNYFNVFRRHDNGSTDCFAMNCLGWIAMKQGYGVWFDTIKEFESLDLLIEFMQMRLNWERMAEKLLRESV